MISSKNRFHLRGSLNYVYKKGTTVRTESVSLRYVDARQEDFRLAVVVSKKVSKSAVVRNRIRRRIYEIVRLHRKEAGKPWPTDMIITVFDDRAAAVPSPELTATIRNLLQKSGF